jgi:uncharacterized protein (DUF58 family)
MDLPLIDSPLIAQTEVFRYASQWPWAVLALVALLLGLAIWRLRVYPTWWWMAPLAISLVLSVFAIFFPVLSSLVLLADGVLVALVTVDLALLCANSRHNIHAQRRVARTASLGVDLPSELTIENASPLRLRGALRDDLPMEFECRPSSHRLDLPPRSRVTMRRMLMPRRRGAFQLDHVYLQLSSPLRLWVRQVTLNVNSRLNVYPDMKQLSDYALLARTNRLSLIGVRRTRRIGQDSDFERLRDYTRDDNYRHIDWRSTARRRKLTVRQFQSDQSQRIIFMLDCGRMMTNQREGYSLLDHALNAMLMMSYVALVQGDEVGMLCFSDSVHSYLPPRGGASQMNRLLQAGFDQFPRMVESRYDDAFLYLSNHCKRRSLVALATSVIDEVNASQIVDYLANLTGRHLPLGVLIRDRQMFDAADAPDGGPLNMYAAAVAADILLWRHQRIVDLQHRGVLVVDAFPDELTAPLVNEYLRIKAKHLL